jgi:biopolymer transport protein ExbB
MVTMVVGVGRPPPTRFFYPQPYRAFPRRMTCARRCLPSGAKPPQPVSNMYAVYELPGPLGRLPDMEECKTMLLSGLANLVLFKTQMAAVWLFQETGSRFDPGKVWGSMEWPARAIVVVLMIMSAWSLGVMIDRWAAYRAARKQSLQFAPAVAGALREGNVDAAILVAERNKKSHLAKVVNSGLLEFRVQGKSADSTEEQIEASKRALERAEAIVHAELERGLSALATIGSIAPFVGLLRTVIGIMDAFRNIQEHQGTSITAVSGGISEALVTTALGLFVAIPAVMMFNYFTTKMKAFDVEMNNSSSEMMDYFLKRAKAART